MDPSQALVSAPPGNSGNSGMLAEVSLTDMNLGGIDHRKEDMLSAWETCLLGD